MIKFPVYFLGSHLQVFLLTALRHMLTNIYTAYIVDAVGWCVLVSLLLPIINIAVLRISLNKFSLFCGWLFDSIENATLTDQTD